MTSVTRMRPLLTAIHRYDKSLSTRDRDRGRIIEAPILAYLIETTNGRILYDVGCDYRKIATLSCVRGTTTRRCFHSVRRRCMRKIGCRITWRASG